MGPDHLAAVAGNMVDGLAGNSADFVATVKAGERSIAPQEASCKMVNCTLCKRYALLKGYRVQGAIKQSNINHVL